MELPVNMLKIDVTFYPDNIGLKGPLFGFTGDVGIIVIDGAEYPKISVPQGIAMIVFTLSTYTAPTIKHQPLSSAVFQTSPVQWFETAKEGGGNSGEPALEPLMFMSQRIGDQTLTLIDFNSNQSVLEFDKNHWFNLVIAYEDRTYGSDPVIVNMPPSGK